MRLNAWTCLLSTVAALNVGPDYSHPIEDLDVDLPFSQPVTFAHLEWQRCLAASHDKVRRSFTCAKNQPQRLAPNLAKSPWTLQY